jgi:hypothetical protein
MQASNENVHEHHVTLFSNSDLYHFNNTPTGFTNTLTPPLILKPLGKWRVGMSDEERRSADVKVRDDSGRGRGKRSVQIQNINQGVVNQA